MSAQTITSRSRIWLKSAGETDKDVRLLVSSSFSNDWDNTWDATPAQAGGIYVYYQGAKYSIWASNEYSQNLALAFDANDNTEYTLSFASFLGEEYTITDLGNNNAVITVNASTQDYVFTIDESEKNSSILNRFVINYVAPAQAYNVKLNAYGYATFSADEEVSVPAGLTVWTGSSLSAEELSCEALSGGYIPANTGVLLWGDANAEFSLPIVANGNASAINNLFIPASEWANFGGQGLVLSGNMLYKYEGADFKANKAFLELPAGNPAPRRIRFVVDQATGVENVEATVKAEKFIENGQVLIKRGEAVYNLQGQIVK